MTAATILALLVNCYHVPAGPFKEAGHQRSTMAAQTTQQINAVLHQLESDGLLDDQFTQLQQLQDESNPDFVKEVVELYFEDSASKLQNLAARLRVSVQLYCSMQLDNSCWMGAQRLEGHWAVYDVLWVPTPLTRSCTVYGNHGGRRRVSFVCSSQRGALLTADVEANSLLLSCPCLFCDGQHCQSTALLAELCATLAGPCP